MDDHRRLKRRHLLYCLRVVDRDTGEPVGSLVDITREGLMLIGPRPLDTGRVHRLRMDLPPAVVPGDRLDLDAEGVWSRRDHDPALHVTGFRLLDPTLESRHAIHLLIDDYGLLDRARRAPDAPVQS